VFLVFDRVEKIARLFTAHSAGLARIVARLRDLLRRRAW
jgi:hypothetical protein